MRTFIALAIVLMASAALAQEKPTTAPAAPRLSKAIPLPGVKGRIDHLAIDPAGKRLFLAALGNDTVEVIDLATNKHAKSLKSFREPQGVAWMDDLKMLAVACNSGQVLLFDSDLKALGALRDYSDADNIRYDPGEKRLYVAFRDGIAIIDPQTRRTVGGITIAGHPESFQLERNGPRMFINIPRQNAVVLADRKANSVTGKLPLGDAKANFPMALDEPHQRLLVACRAPARLLLFDLKTTALASSADCVGDADDICFDDRTNTAYVIGGEGRISAIAVASGKLQALDHISTAPGARTGTIDVEARRLYVAVPQATGHDAELRVYELP